MVAPPISRWGEDGFSSCSACPCHRAVPTTPPECRVASVSLRRAILPSPVRSRLGLRGYFCRGHLWVHLRYGPVTHSPSIDGFVGRLHPPRFLDGCDSSYRATDFCSGGFDSTEHTSLRWTHSLPKKLFLNPSTGLPINSDTQGKIASVQSWTRKNGPSSATSLFLVGILVCNGRRLAQRDSRPVFANASSEEGP